MLGKYLFIGFEQNFEETKHVLRKFRTKIIGLIENWEGLAVFTLKKTRSLILGGDDDHSRSSS
jgi:hypothetical protein